MKFTYSKFLITLSFLTELNLSQSAHEHNHVSNVVATSITMPFLDNSADTYQQNPQVSRAPQVPQTPQPLQVPQAQANHSSCSDSCARYTYFTCMAQCALSQYAGLDNLVRSTGLDTLYGKIFGSTASTTTPVYIPSPTQNSLGPMTTEVYATNIITYSHSRSENHSKTIRPMKLTPTPLNPYDITARTDWSQITIETYDLDPATSGYTSNSIGTRPTGTVLSATSVAPLTLATTDSVLSTTLASKTAITVTETTKSTTKSPLTTTLASGSLSLYNQNTNSIRISSTYLIFAITLLVVSM